MEVTRADLADFAREIVKQLPNARGNKAYCIGLSGPLGAGKTTFVQLLAEALGVKETVPSPTFTLMRPYELSHPVFTRLIHIDAYRLSEETFLQTGVHPYLEDPSLLVLIEWPENLGKFFPKDALVLAFSHHGEETRILEKHGG